MDVPRSPRSSCPRYPKYGTIAGLSSPASWTNLATVAGSLAACSPSAAVMGLTGTRLVRINVTMVTPRSKTAETSPRMPMYRTTGRANQEVRVDRALPGSASATAGSACWLLDECDIHRPYGVGDHIADATGRDVVAWSLQEGYKHTGLVGFTLPGFVGCCASITDGGFCCLAGSGYGRGLVSCPTSAQAHWVAGAEGGVVGGVWEVWAPVHETGLHLAGAEVLKKRRNRKSSEFDFNADRL